MARYSLLILLLFSLFSCQEAVDPNVILVPDNTAPPDLTVPKVIKENYINKLYITLLGRKVTETERQTALQILDQNQTSIEDRKELIVRIQSETAYFSKQYDLMRLNLLNNLDTTEITAQISIINLLLADPQYEPVYDQLLYEKPRLVKLRNTPKDLTQGQITRIQAHINCVDNFFYDEINMGTQNFILSMFESFLGRNPTTAEEEAAIQMVDGIEAVLFGEVGEGKADFLNIFFSSNNYFEGQVLEVYENFLFRSPNTVEMSTATINYKTTSDYQLLLQDILSTDEYLGIE